MEIVVLMNVPPGINVRHDLDDIQYASVRPHRRIDL